MGGAAGHMNHPYDLSWVNTGEDLIRFFELAKDVEGTVKIDGVNVSFKVVGDGDNKQFAVDRGSLKMIDIEGVTLDRVEERFPREGHGMRRMVPNLLNILNEALPSVRSELEVFGMWDDPSKFLNTEYVEGTTNVTAYDKNFLAIHGLNQFFQKIGKVGKAKGVERPGLDRPKGVAAPSVEIPYDEGTMAAFVKKINAVAQNYGFEVISEAQVRRMEGTEVDFSEALGENLTIRLSDDRELTKPLSEWLSEVTNPRYKLIKGMDGKTYNALHRELYYKLVEEGIPVTELIDQADAEDAIFGAVMVHAVRTLGNVLLRASTSDLGDLTSHEGIVLRNKRKFKTANPVKITGEFILGNLGGGFGGAVPPGARDDEEDEWYSPEHETRADAKFADRHGEESVDINIIDDEDADPVGGGTIAIVPGAFKPPHKGHADMVRQYAQMADEVVVLISKPLKQARKLPNGREITAEDSLKIWDLLVGDLPNVTVGVFNDPAIRSPMSAAYAIAGAPADREAAAAKVEPGIDAIQPGTEIILGASTKGGDAKRWARAEKYIGGGPEGDLILIDPAMSVVKPLERPDGEPYSATDMRDLLGDAQNNIPALEDFIGKGNVPELLSILGLGAPIEEISGMGNGSVSGGSGGSVPLRRSSSGSGPGNRDVKKKRKKKKNEYIDLSLIDEIYELLSERGVIK